MQEARKKIRAILFASLLIVISILLLRFILEFARTSHPIIIFFFTLTQPLVSFFETISFVGSNISSIIAIAFFGILTYVVSKVLGGIEARSPEVQLRESIEALTRALEFVILARVVFKLVGIAATSSPFVGTLYLFTEWTQGLLQPIAFDFGTLEVSSLIVLAIVILVDISTETLLNFLKYIRLGRLRGSSPKNKEDEEIDELSTQTQDATSSGNDLQEVMTKLMPKNPPISNHSNQDDVQEG